MGDSHKMPIERQWTDDDDVRAVPAMSDLVGSGRCAGALRRCAVEATRPLLINPAHNAPILGVHENRVRPNDPLPTFYSLGQLTGR